MTPHIDLEKIIEKELLPKHTATNQPYMTMMMILTPRPPGAKLALPFGLTRKACPRLQDVSIF